jgi:hypothetical protein
MDQVNGLSYSGYQPSYLEFKKCQTNIISELAIKLLLWLWLLLLRNIMVYEPWPLFKFLVLYTVGRSPWTWDQPVPTPLPTSRTTQTQNKHTQISKPWVAFEPRIPVFELANIYQDSDFEANGIGNKILKDIGMKSCRIMTWPVV